MATKKYYAGIDLQQNELQNAVIHKSATAPSSPSEGQVYYNTTSDKLFVYDGSSWNEIGSTALTVAEDSTAFVTINNGELSFSNLAITGVTVDTTQTSLANFIIANYTVGNEFQEGDMIILTNATDQTQRSWIHNGGTAVSSADFTRLQTDLDMAAVRAEFVGGDALTYTEATGTFDVNVDDATIEVTTDTLNVKDGGITQAKLDTTLESKIVTGYAETVGDGTATSFTITHNLGTQDVMTTMYEVSTGECVECQVTRDSNDQITVGAFPAPATSDLRILVQKMILA